MFARVKKSGLYKYLQIVQNRREGAKTIQRVVATIGRMDQIQQKGEIENLVRSLSRFSEKVLLILSGKSDVRADARKIGPAMICERLWKESGDRQDHPSASGRAKVWLRCGAGHLPDGSASALCIRFGPLM